MENYLKMVTNELKCAQLTIKILQEERINTEKSLNKNNLWKRVEYYMQGKTNSENEGNNHKSRNAYIPVLTNRCAPKDIEGKEMRKSRIENVKNKTKKEKKMKQKIIIIGDSNVKGMAKEPKYRLNQEFEIQGITKPESTLEKLVKTTYSDLKTLTKRDVFSIQYLFSIPDIR
jgi:hypothetical protein